MTASIIVFVIIYLFIATEKVEKAIVATIGGAVVILLHLIDFDSAVQSIDLNVIFLLVGMMSCVAILAETGFFEYIAMTIAKKSGGNVMAIVIFLLLVTMVFSAFLDNVTTIILLAPVTILLAQILELPAKTLLILEAISSNIGGTATLIGDPPNIIIGSQAKLSFNQYLIHLAPCVIIISVFFLLTVYLLMRKRLVVPEKIRRRVLESYPELAIRNKKDMFLALGVFVLVFVGFFLHSLIHIPPGIIAISGMGLMMIVCKGECDKYLKAVEWDTILFFVGLFIVIGALEHNGAVDVLVRLMKQICGQNMLLSCIIILWGSAIFSSFLDNIPFVMAVLPMVQRLAEDSHSPASMTQALFWSLSLGACLGGNGTLIGASANVVSAKIGQKNNYPITFANFSLYGAPFMVQSLIISTVYIWFRYFYLS